MRSGLAHGFLATLLYLSAVELGAGSPAGPPGPAGGNDPPSGPGAPGGPGDMPATGHPLVSSFGVPGRSATYDYVVVGGGTAGLTIASRLVEAKAGTVAVIEAGTFYELSNGNLSQIPAMAANFAGKSPNDTQPLIDWGYVTTPQAGSDGLVMHYPRGKTLGGSSARNFMLYHRPTVGCMHQWAQQVGDAAYEWPRFLPWFKKSIRFTPENSRLRLANSTMAYSTRELQGAKPGPLDVTFPNYVYAFPTWMAKAFPEIGVPWSAEGLQDGTLSGFAYSMYTVSQHTGLRASSETAFLRLADPNYFVYPLTLAKRLLFDEKKKATGVVVNTAGANYTLSARKEVILSAGCIGSPQLLQVSGVGPAALVSSLGVPLVADRPGVGQNFQDQIVFGVTHAVNVITASSFGQPAYLAAQEALFNKSPAQGSLVTPGGEIMAWEKLRDGNASLGAEAVASLANLPADWPDIEYLVTDAPYGNGSTQYAAILAALAAPLSRGSVNATTADTADQPKIDPGFLTHKTDLEVSVAAFKRLRAIWASDALDGVRVSDEVYPGPEIVTDEDMIKSIRASFQTVYHGSCTCAMGRKNDRMAVVDTKARVYGVQDLRVVDASAFPFLPPGHPQATVCEFP